MPPASRARFSLFRAVFRHSSRDYRPAWWLPGPHSATLWGRFARREPLLPSTVERWEAPDGDFLDVIRSRVALPPDAPRLLVLHGLEGGSHSHYAKAMFREAHSRGWAA